MNRLPLFERLQIESSAMCNRSCWFCPRIYDASGKYLDDAGNAVHHKMPTNIILGLLDQAQAIGFTGRVGFHHYSEPLLDPRNLDLAREARSRGMQPCLVTNGDVLKRSPNKCGKVCQVYDHIVIGLYDYESDEELDQEKAFWTKQLPVPRLEFSPIGPSTGRVHSVVAPRAIVPHDARIRAPDLTYKNAPCHRPLIRMIVQHDGEVALCCEDVHGEFQLGTIYAESLEQIWQSERHIEIVQDLIAGNRENYDLCKCCPASPTGPAANGRRIEIAPRQVIASRKT